MRLCSQREMGRVPRVVDFSSLIDSEADDFILCHNFPTTLSKNKKEKEKRKIIALNDIRKLNLSLSKAMMICCL